MAKSSGRAATAASPGVVAAAVSPAAAARSGPSVTTAAALVAAVAGGSAVAIQSRIGGELATRTGSALEAAAAVSVLGLVLVAVVLPFRRTGLRRLRAASTRPWWWCGGLGGATFLAAAAYGVPRVGTALATVCLVAGTTIGALFTDQFGLGPSGRHAATGWRLAGVVVVICAVVIAALGGGHGSLRPLILVMLLAAGATTAVQQAANGQIRGAADDVIVAAAVSFLGGALIAATVVAATGNIHPGRLPATPWLYLGAPLGLAYILVGATMVRVLGVLRFVLAAVAGQLLASVVLDAVWPEPGRPLRAATVVGAVVTVIGVWISGRGESHGSPVGIE